MVSCCFQTHVENQGLKSACICPKHWRWRLEVGRVLGISDLVPHEGCLLRSGSVASVAGLSKPCWEERTLSLSLCSSSFMDLSHRRDFLQASWPLSCGSLYVTHNHRPLRPGEQTQPRHHLSVTQLMADLQRTILEHTNVLTSCLLTTQGLHISEIGLKVFKEIRCHWI